MDNQNTRNTVIFFVCAFALMAIYQVFVFGPMQKHQAAEQKAKAQIAAVQPIAAAAPGAAVFVNRDQALAQSPRVQIDTPSLKGSVALKGGRIDDLYMKGYPETLAKNSPPVELFRPEGAKQGYFADFGWMGSASTAQATWTAPAGATLSVGHPVTLTYDNGQGLVFTRTLAVDDKFMFTVTNTVANKGAAAVQLAPYASIQRQGMPQLTPINIIHEGGIGVLGEGQDAGHIPLISGSTHTLRMQAFKNWRKTGDTDINSTGGWIGVTDHYWLSALAPDQKEAIKGSFRVTTINNVDVFEANYTGAVRMLPPGGQTSETTYLFAGAKRVSVLQAYGKTLGIPRFDDAVDWGFEWFLTKPIFWLLEFFHKVVGNFGVAILLLTLVVKALLFPLANRSFASMSKMKKLQPEMEAIKKRFPDDAAKQQQETMALYQREKINPVAGCLPVLVQIPIWYALYKVLYVTLEMRHAPFFGWIKDLSAPDPTAWGNLFGLIPYDPSKIPLAGTILAIGVWPLLYGAVQWLTTQMSPQATTDPTQKIMMQLFPLVFTVMLAHSPSGILIYWTWSSSLTIVQQYVIMHRYGAENPIDDLIAKLRGKPKQALIG
jgi:YidC/Oxa1 family membrane protein insertase